MARMAQYIGLTAAAQQFVDTKLIPVEEDTVHLTHGRILTRNYWLDLADNAHPMGLWKDPDSDTYYLEVIQVRMHSSGPMYFTCINRFEGTALPVVFGPWVGNIYQGTDLEYGQDTGTIYGIDVPEIAGAQYFPSHVDTINYSPTQRCFLWGDSEQKVRLTFRDNGFRLLNQNKVMLHLINDIPYLVKADGHDVIYSIQRLSRVPEGNDLSNISRKTVSQLVFDVESASYKRFR